MPFPIHARRPLAPPPRPPHRRHCRARARGGARTLCTSQTQTAHHLPPRAARRPPAPCLHRGGAARKTRPALRRTALAARPRVTARHKAAAPTRLASRPIHQPMPPTQARLPIERGMLQRLRVRTAEFPLNVHVVNVAAPPPMYVTPPCNVRSYNQSPHYHERARPRGTNCLTHPEAGMRNAPPNPRRWAARSTVWPPDGRIVAQEREEALVLAAQSNTKPRITPSSRRASPAGAVP